MKKTIFIIFISVLSHSIVIGQTDSIAQKNIYVVLNRNSCNIQFTESKRIDGSPSSLFYSFDTNVKHDFIYEMIFTHAYAPLLGRTDERKKIPISFIDSIPFLDEKYIREAYFIDTHEFHWNKIKNKKIYLIDTGTVQNDSLMMFEVSIGYHGFEL